MRFLLTFVCAWAVPMYGCALEPDESLGAIDLWLPPCTIFGCDDGDPCTQDKCTAAGCVHPVAVNGIYCNEPGGMGVCLYGLCCLGVIDTSTPAWSCISCDDANPCTWDTGYDGCLHAPQPAGFPCQLGVCDGSGNCLCNDGNPCTVDALIAGVCGFKPLPGGTPCDDGAGCAGTCFPPHTNPDGSVDAGSCDCLGSARANAGQIQ
jgi:hypothetical protein